MIKNIKFIIASAILISLTACGTPTSTTTQTDTPPASPESTTASPSPTATPETTASTTEGIIFKDAVKDKLHGYIESLNNAKTTTQTIASNKPIYIAGWAIAPDQSKPADTVLITYGDNNTVATTIPVSVARPDVAQAFKNPALEKSGWVATLDPATLNLPAETTKIKAWSYDSQTKEAYPLNNSYEIVLK
ncbi:hypothetical protein C7H19_02440 [Aphanothece hegewaldii CCALA 016]|uniref:Lipoprotein n=1 Tax=Aphanothece hegewaldii CCALA 016 TaxID=2107694 RepID=A0A2T1M2F9_9CHRO|nr:hypothetical protein [Aphanothece hegewaldii]PSF38933.1 hypothetical protein C7H19_02440 [Aphanothece hegewaldii CCALA 016]